MTLDTYLDDLLALPRISAWLRPKVSRDGQWVAWTWMGGGSAGDVFLAATDGSTGPIRLTASEEFTFLESWTPDSKAVIVAQDKGGNERYQLSRVDIEKPFEMEPLTEADPPYFLRGGDLHPNGRWLIYGANYDIKNGQEIEPTWIYRHDLQSGERLVLAKPRQGAYTRPVLSPDGRYVLYSRADLHPAGRQVWLVDIEGGHDREILNFGNALKTYAAWFPDGNKLLVLSETNTHMRVGIWTLADELVTWLIDDPGRTIEEAFVPYGSESIVVIEVREAQDHAILLNPQTTEEKALSLPSATLIPIAPAANKEWIGLVFSSNQPDDIVRFDIGIHGPGDLQSLASVWQQTSLTQHDFTKAESYRWRSVDGLEIQGWLYHPREVSRGTIVYVHGGPTSHSMDKINNQIQFFARAGFTVLDPNYRGSTGFGLAFREAIKVEGWGGLEQDDIRTGIESLIKADVAQPGRVGVTGTSYGGYSSWCAITRYPMETVAAAAPICGMTDLVIDYETTRPDLRPYSEEMMGGSPTEIPEKYHARSPINHVANIEGGLLIVQGEQDPNVTPQNVHEVRQVLEEAGIPYELLTFADEGHGISKSSNQKTLMLTMLDFFTRAFSDSGL